MNVYKYNDNGEYIGTEEALLDPLETEQQEKEVYLLPANATFTAPPAEKEGFARVWNGEAWQEVEDHRGTEYWLPGDKYGTPSHEMKELGTLPEGATLTPPEQTMEEVKKAKIAELKVERDNREQDVLTYNGKGFDYDLKSVAKLNEARDVLMVDGGSQAWICADSSITALTADDITEIKRLGKERSNDLHMQYAALKVYVEGLQDKAAVEAVTFDTEIDVAAQINLP